LRINGFELAGRPDDKERVILGVAAGTIHRDDFLEWIQQNCYALGSRTLDEGE
jgi:hypothetical protein